VEDDAICQRTADRVTALHEFRARLYACVNRCRDALFELTDALLSAG